VVSRADAFVIESVFWLALGFKSYGRLAAVEGNLPFL
jgi:hypothetical protein